MFLLDFLTPFYYLKEIPRLSGSFLFWIIWILVAIVSMFVMFLQWRDNGKNS